MFASSEVARASSFPALLALDIDVAILNREDAKKIIKNHQKAYGRDLNDAEINDHITRGARPGGVSWLNSFGIFKASENL